MSFENREGIGVPLRWQVVCAAALVGFFLVPHFAQRLPSTPAPARPDGVLVKCPEPKPGEVMIVVLGAQHPDGAPRRYRCIGVSSVGAYRRERM